MSASTSTSTPPPSTMRALTTTNFSHPPTLTTTAPVPTPSPTQTLVRMLASSLPQLVRSQANGTHYSVRNVTTPYIPGIDGVGYTVPDGRLVFMNLLSARPAPGGAFAEYVVVEEGDVTELDVTGDGSEGEGEGQGKDVTVGSGGRDVQRENAIKVAALSNPALSSWMALKQRARVDELAEAGQGWNVMILGATSVSGRVAARFARRMGAKEVVGVARDAGALEELKQRGLLDHIVVLDKGDVTRSDFGVLDKIRVHVVLDYVWGTAALAVMSALPSSSSKADELEVRWVHIGSLGRELDVSVPGALLRSKNLVISGSGPGSWSLRALKRETGGVVTAIAEVVPSEGWREEYKIVERRLVDVEEAWRDKEARTVFVM